MATMTIVTIAHASQPTLSAVVTLSDGASPATETLVPTLDIMQFPFLVRPGVRIGTLPLGSEDASGLSHVQ